MNDKKNPCRMNINLNPMKVINKQFLYFLVTMLLCCGQVTAQLNAVINIVSGPTVRIPGITTPTVLRLSGYDTDLGPVRWKRNGSNSDVGGGNEISVTTGGDYYAEQNWSSVEGNPFWRHLGSITVPALQYTLQLTGPNPIDVLNPPQLRINTNASGYVVAIKWYRNTVEQTTLAGRTYLDVLYPGTYRLQITYEFGSQRTSIYSNTIVINPSVQAPAVHVSRNTYDPVSPEPVLTVTNPGNFTHLYFWDHTDTRWPIAGASRTISRPGRYKIEGYLPNGFRVFANEIVITRGSIPAPVIASDANFELTYTNPDLRLSTATNYHAGYTWYFNNQELPGRPAYFDVISPGVYKVKGCALHPDGQIECKTSAEVIVTRPHLPVPGVTADGNNLTYEDPVIRLSTQPYGNTAEYTWYRNGGFVSRGPSLFIDTNTPGAYTVQVCVRYPDNVLHCSQRSESFTVTGETLRVNYVRNKKVRVENIRTPQEVDALSGTEVAVSTAYCDAFSRPLQQVMKAHSPQGNDLISFFAYDPFGREYRKYLPYVRETQHGQYIHMRADNPVQLLNFYQDADDAVADSDYPFSETVFELSPIGRIREQGAPGEDWQPGTGHTQRFGYITNTTGHNVRIWKESAQGLVSEGSYVTASLAIKETTDAHGFKHRLYTDKEGRNVLQEEPGENGEKLRTYFVYNDLGKLICIVPPKTSKNIGTTSPVVINEATLAAECFRYAYDERGRLIRKQVPGAGPVYMVYDPWDRVVLSQTANQRARNHWSFTKYDAYDRPVMTGEVPLALEYHAARQAIDDFYRTGILINPAIRYESPGDAIHGYTNRSYPVLSGAGQVYVATYYDSYSFLEQFGTAYGFTAEPLLGLTENFPRVRGLITGTKSLVLGTNDYLKTVNYYNRRYQLIQAVGDNYTGGKDRQSSQYDFTGSVIREKIVHQGLESVQVGKRYEYDHRGRLLKVYHQINAGPEILLTDNHYNELGELMEKNLHAIDDKFLQSIDYRYTINGWLSSMNDVSAEPGAVYDDLYAFKLSYNEFSNPGGLDYQPAYNGNVTAFTEKRPFSRDNTPFESVYTYRYDSRNQLKQGKYYQLSNRLHDGRYDLLNITYDANGNILGLQRKGLIDGVPGTIDDLQYYYNGNQLSEVQELGNSQEGFIKK
jgi:hypothetical protein